MRSSSHLLAGRRYAHVFFAFRMFLLEAIWHPSVPSHLRLQKIGKGRLLALSPLVIGQQLSGYPNFTANSAAVGDKENPIRTRVLLRAVAGTNQGTVTGHSRAPCPGALAELPPWGIRFEPHNQGGTNEAIPRNNPYSRATQLRGSLRSEPRSSCSSISKIQRPKVASRLGPMRQT